MQAIEAVSQDSNDRSYIDDGEDPEGTFVGWFYVEYANGKQYKIYVEPREDEEESGSESESDFDIECSLEPCESRMQTELTDNHDDII